MATNYNPAAGLFADKVVMMEYDGAMSQMVTQSMMHGVECDPDKLSGTHGKYIRNNPVLQNQDIKTYDHALFQLAVANSPTAFANQTIGELWVSYTVRLRKPKFYSSRGLGISQDIYVSGNGTETTTALLGTSTAILTAQQNNIGCLLTLTANTIKITFPAAYAGFLEISLYCDLITTTGSMFSNPAYAGNCVAVSDIYGTIVGSGDAPDSILRTSGVLTAQQAILVAHVKVTPATLGTDNTFSIITSNVSVAPSQTQLKIQEYNSGFGYKANNIGPPNTQTDAIILVNPSGAVVVP